MNCNVCKTEKGENDFYYRKSGKIIKPCKECTKNRVSNNSAKIPIEVKRENWNKWSNLNRDHLNEYSSSYRANNKEILGNIAKKYRDSKRDDKHYQIVSSLRKKLVYYVIQKPSNNNIELFSATPKFIRAWIEYQFTEEMNWDNYGNYWNFDHINPYDNFNLEEDDEQLKCCHWSNIQPLSYKNNSGKKNKIDEELIIRKKNEAQIFKQEYQ